MPDEVAAPIPHHHSLSPIPFAISMCGRFGLTRPEALQLERFGITDLPALEPRYNIPPSSDVLVVRERKGITEAEMIRWGLV
ncbi:MAG TPA: SOS response-associated peptidase family protein, partial [Gemmatimonadaceae bacterium]